MEKKALLITYYWPPAGGPGVHRWLRFSKYFKENNCGLTVYCPENAAWPVVDNHLINEIPKDIKVIRKSIFEPQAYFQKKAGFTGGAGIGNNGKMGLIKKIMIWIRGNFFIPDARKFWIKPSVKFLSDYLQKNSEITHLISTGPPHSMHVIALQIKKQFPHIKWVADFRDPWTEIDYYEELNLGKYADRKQKKLEKEVLSLADMVVTIGKDCADGLKRISNREIKIITNGFIFPEFDSNAIHLDKKFTIAHFGAMAASRNPELLWKALKELLNEISDLKNHLEINLFGSVDFSVEESLKKHNLIDYYTGVKNVSHTESIATQRSTQILLLVANKSINTKGILTGKFFEYLGAKRPILGIGAKGSDLEQIIHETQSGCFVDYNNLSSLKKWLNMSFESYLKHELHSNAKNVSQFHSKKLTMDYIRLLESV